MLFLSPMFAKSIRIDFANIGERKSIISLNNNLSTQNLKILHQVVGEGVEIIYHQKLNGFPPPRWSPTPSASSILLLADGVGDQVPGAN